MLNFEVPLPLKKPLVTTFAETRELTSRNYQVKKGLKFQNHQKTEITLVVVLRFGVE